MNYLLDTCTLLWLTDSPKKLSAAVISRIDDNRDTLFVSDTSKWEICVKWTAEKLPLPKPPSAWIPQQMKLWKISTLPIKSEHLFRTTQLPLLHRDPFDRLLVAQSIHENIALMTPDPTIHAYPLETIW